MRASLAVALLLSACGGGTVSSANQASPVESGYIAKVQALTPAQRDGVLLRAIMQSGGAACQGVEKAQALAPAKAGLPAWLVTCTEGSHWQVTLADDGIATVTPTADPKRLGPADQGHAS